MYDALACSFLLSPPQIIVRHSPTPSLPRTTLLSCPLRAVFSCGLDPFMPVPSGR
ncbi:hypothetical protein B0H10DRAFT_2053534, partial [Mycena sp. CBHHK59/15]